MFRRLAAPAAGRRGGEIAGGRRRQTEWEEVEEQLFLDQSGGANGAGRGRGVDRVAVWVLLVGWA